MSTFSKLSVMAQYDDMCRVIMTLVRESEDEENASIAMLERLKERWNKREASHERDKAGLRIEMNTLQKEIKKLNRQLNECRSALGREVEEKKCVARERKALMDQIRQVRQLVESKDGIGNSDDHRKRVIKCLDIDNRLSPIQSDDSDDCQSGLDYDRTEEDILDTERSPRSNVFDKELENLMASNNEQPTMLCRYFDKETNNRCEDEPRNRRSAGGVSTRLSKGANTESARDKYGITASMDTDSNEFDDDGIEFVRQQLKKIEAEKKELAAGLSTPELRNQNKAATLTAVKSVAGLSKAISNISTPVPNVQKPHAFVSKKSFKPDSCGPCGKKITFYSNVSKCENCCIISHPECKELCPLPCIKITAPAPSSRSKKNLISDYVNKDSVPKVPALIVHCCNEIERDDNITTPGLYRVVSHKNETEDLYQKILKSKTGMPNLSKIDVHLLCGVNKVFLQHLDESLITTTLWSNFSEAVGSDADEITQRTHMRYFIGYDLPGANRDTLAYLMLHLHAIAKHSDKNLMDLKSLARAMAPTVVGNSVRNPPPSTINTEKPTQVKIMEALLEIDEEFWTTFVQKSAPQNTTTTLGSRLLASTPQSSHKGPRTRSSARLGGTLPTPKLKPLFS